MIWTRSSVSRGGQERSRQRRFLARNNSAIDISREAVNPHRIRLASLVFARDRSNRRTHWDLHFSPAVPGVTLASSGAEGLMCPNLFSGVLDLTFVGPGPAVEGLSPLGPEGSTACWISGDFSISLRLSEDITPILCFIECLAKSNLLVGRKQD